MSILPVSGRCIGAAVVSPKHANFIINEGGASAADVEALIGQVVTTVRRETGVALRREVRIVGEAGSIEGTSPDAASRPGEGT